jgi:hypothetical protein
MVMHYLQQSKCLSIKVIGRKKIISQYFITEYY